LVLKTKTNPATAPVSAKLKALLKIAGIVQKGGKSVLAEDIEQARQLGATDLEIHDTVRRRTGDVGTRQSRHVPGARRAAC
jgi:hypothetical protein